MIQQKVRQHESVEYFVYTLRVGLLVAVVGS